MIENALKSINLQDDFYRIIITSCHINQGCYLLMDNLLWLNSMQITILNPNTSKEMNKWSNKFWLFSNILMLARDIHDLLGILFIQEESIAQKSQSDLINKYSLNQNSGAYTSNTRRPFYVSPKLLLIKIIKKLRRVLMDKKNRPLLLDTTKNVFDIFLPLSSLEFVKISPGTQGLCGLVSSLISLIVVFDSKYKLSP
jgi:peroxin-11B